MTLQILPSKRSILTNLVHTKYTKNGMLIGLILRYGHVKMTKLAGEVVLMDKIKKYFNSNVFFSHVYHMNV